MKIEHDDKFWDRYLRFWTYVTSLNIDPTNDDSAYLYEEVSLRLIGHINNKIELETYGKRSRIKENFTLH